MSNINKELRTAVCEACGPVNVKYGAGGVGRPRYWKCRNGLNQIERKYTASKGGTCSRCDFEPEHSCQLDVHHKDGNHLNDDPVNLETICANCHRLITFRQACESRLLKVATKPKI